MNNLSIHKKISATDDTDPARWIVQMRTRGLVALAPTSSPPPPILVLVTADTGVFRECRTRGTRCLGTSSSITRRCYDVTICSLLILYSQQTVLLLVLATVRSTVLSNISTVVLSNISTVPTKVILCCCCCCCVGRRGDDRCWPSGFMYNHFYKTDSHTPHVARQKPRRRVSQSCGRHTFPPTLFVVSLSPPPPPPPRPSSSSCSSSGSFPFSLSMSLSSDRGGGGRGGGMSSHVQ